ncbi:MAG: hypothetical protein SPL42_01275 [Bacteroidales bacterium]|nr:hypothetical protein [Bacteroidales bacterium]
MSPTRRQGGCTRYPTLRSTSLRLCGVTEVSCLQHGRAVSTTFSSSSVNPYSAYTSLSISRTHTLVSACGLASLF